jgi:hypothetical protein
MLRFHNDEDIDKKAKCYDLKLNGKVHLSVACTKCFTIKNENDKLVITQSKGLCEECSKILGKDKRGQFYLFCLDDGEGKHMELIICDLSFQRDLAFHYPPQKPEDQKMTRSIDYVAEHDHYYPIIQCTRCQKLMHDYGGYDSYGYDSEPCSHCHIAYCLSCCQEMAHLEIGAYAFGDLLWCQNCQLKVSQKRKSKKGMKK